MRKKKVYQLSFLSPHYNSPRLYWILEGEYEFTWCKEVDGLGIIENFITKEEEEMIFKEIEKDDFFPRFFFLLNFEHVYQII